MTTTDQQQAVPAWWRQLTRPLVFAVAIVLGIYILRRIPMTIEVFIVATLIARRFGRIAAWSLSKPASVLSPRCALRARSKWCDCVRCA